MTNLSAFLNNQLLKYITIPVCQNCGERYYDRNTMRFLEKTKKKLESEKKINLQEVGKILSYEAI